MMDTFDNLLQYLTGQLVYGFMECPEGSALGATLDFFLFETVKVLLLILLISLLMGFVNAVLPVRKIRAILTRNRLFGAQYLLASAFGAITPFCSCSSIPLFIGMVRGGIPLGVTLSFLITSPLVNEVAVAMFLSLFGWKVTLIYTASGMLMGMLGGAVLERFRLERMLTPWVQDMLKELDTPGPDGTAGKKPIRFRAIWQEAWGIVRGIFLYVVIGIAAGAAAHGYVPEDFFADLMRPDNYLALPAAMLCAVPLYANAAAIVPVIGVLVSKGVPLGTAIAFMMATVGLSLPEAILLRKVMSAKLIAIFFGTVTLAIVILGYTFNVML